MLAAPLRWGSLEGVMPPATLRIDFAGVRPKLSLCLTVVLVAGLGKAESTGIAIPLILLVALLASDVLGRRLATL